MNVNTYITYIADYIIYAAIIYIIENLFDLLDVGAYAHVPIALCEWYKNIITCAALTRQLKPVYLHSYEYVNMYYVYSYIYRIFWYYNL